MTHIPEDDHCDASCPADHGRADICRLVLTGVWQTSGAISVSAVGRPVDAGFLAEGSVERPRRLNRTGG